MIAAGLVAGLSALALAISAMLSKQLTATMPARQLIGPLLALNALLVLPAVGATAWVATGTAWWLHVAEVALLLLGSWAVWDLFDHGAASATVSAQSLSPIPAVLVAFVALPGTVVAADVGGALLVVAGVSLALRGAFGSLSGRRRWATVLAAAVAAGTLTVTSRMLADLGVGIVATYFTRTVGAAVVALLLFPPRDVPWRQLPSLVSRSVMVTAHFIGVLLAVRLGSPATVQAVVATAPLLTLLLETFRHRRPASPRVVLGTGAVSLGLVILVTSAGPPT